MTLQEDLPETPSDSVIRLINSTEEVIGALTPAIDACSHIADLGEVMPKLIQQIQNAVGKVTTLETQHRTDQSEFTRLQAQLQEAKVDLSTTTGELDKHRNDLESLRSQLRTTSGDLDSAQERKVRLDSSLVSLREEITQCEEAKQASLKLKHEIETELSERKVQVETDIELRKKTADEDIGKQHERAREVAALTESLIKAHQTLEAERAANETDHLKRLNQELQEALTAEKTANQTTSLRKQVVDLTAEIHGRALHDRTAALQNEIANGRAEMETLRQQNKELRSNVQAGRGPDERRWGMTRTGDITKPREARNKAPVQDILTRADGSVKLGTETHASKPKSKVHASASREIATGIGRQRPGEPTSEERLVFIRKEAAQKTSELESSTEESSEEEPARKRRWVGSKSSQRAVSQEHSGIKGSSRRKIVEK